jgi:hypothetical protein
MSKKTSSGPGGASPGGDGWRYVYAAQLLNQAIKEFVEIGARDEARPLFEILMEILARRRAQKSLSE